jgi:YfiH family protein
MDLIHPDWQAPAGVCALMTTRNTVAHELDRLLPSDPAWLKQVHGAHVVDLDRSANVEGDAAITASRNQVCAIRVADCMPVLFVDEKATVIAAAHAGWRGMSGGVLEATIAAMRVPGERLIAWLGPAIGPKAYEVGDEVRAAFKEKDAFSPTRPGHWLLDLYAVARRRLREHGVERIYGGGFCTYSEPARFYSYRRDGTVDRMAAYVWLA